MSKKIGVLGCGWLGLPLAKALVRQSYSVYGTTTSTEKLALLQKEGIIAFPISISASGIAGNIHDFLSNIDILIINIPPKLRSGTEESFVDKIRRLHSAIKDCAVKNVIFTSSTVVYGAIQGEVTEKTEPNPITASGKQLLESEQLFITDDKLHTTVIRFGGLIGPNRHPITMLSGRTNLKNGNDPINLIHLDDCIHMISTILKNELWNELFNGVYPNHPSKKEYYTQEALKRNIPTPDYDTDSQATAGKIVLSQNFLDKLHDFHTPIVS